MRKFAVAVALGAAFVLTPVIPASFSAAAQVKQVQAKTPKPVKGTISSVDSDSVVVSVTNKNGDKKDRTFKTDSNTKITLDGKDAKLSDLKAGETVSVVRGTGKNAPAAEINATSVAADSK